MSKQEWISVVAIIVTLLCTFITAVSTILAPLLQAWYQFKLNNSKGKVAENASAVKKSRLKSIIYSPLFDLSLTVIVLLNSIYSLVRIYNSDDPLSKGQIFSICFYFSFVTLQCVMFILGLRIDLHSKILETLTSIAHSQVEITHQQVSILNPLKNTKPENTDDVSIVEKTT